MCSGASRPRLPRSPSESALGEAPLLPPASPSRNLCQMQEDNSSFSLLLDLLSELYQRQPKIGYHLLYYLRARWVWPPHLRRGQEASWGTSLLPHSDSPTFVIARAFHVCALSLSLF